MSDWDNSRGDVFARGHGMAHGAILVEVLRMLIAKGALTKGEVDQKLTDLRLMFQQPMGTDAQMVAAATVLGIQENLQQATP